MAVEKRERRCLAACGSPEAAGEHALGDAEFVELTQRDRIAFVRALQNIPASPNEKLRQAAERYAQCFRPT